jgi:hypothetical protein
LHDCFTGDGACVSYRRGGGEDRGVEIGVAAGLGGEVYWGGGDRAGGGGCEVQTANVESGVGEAVSELVAGGDVRGVEVAVVDIETFDEGLLPLVGVAVVTVCQIHNSSVVLGWGVGDCVLGL